MPITGLTDRSPSFKEIGRLRLGIPKSEAAVNGPKELPHFRVDMRLDEEESTKAFVNAYKGLTPTRINIRLPFPEIIRVWDANYEVYNTSGMLGMADDKHWLYLRNNKTGELLVEKGEPFMAFDKTIPVYSYKNRKGEDVAVYAKPTGRLKVIVPELKRAAYMVMITHSVYNIMHISEQLSAIDAIARTDNLSLPYVPLVLARRLEKIPVSYNGKKSYQDHYLVNIEIDMRWMSAAFTMLENSLPGMLALPEKIVDGITPEDISEDDSFEAGETGEAETEVYEEPEPYEEPAPMQSRMTAQVTDEASAPEPATPSATMSLETAKAVVGTDGKKYGELATETLQYKASSLTKALKLPNKREAAQLKLDAILTILADRNGGAA